MAQKTTKNVLGQQNGQGIETCFVLTPFKQPFDGYFQKIIKPAIEACGLFAVRGDSLFRPTSIMDDVWTGIQKAKILVAELTERNPNVFYELGLAHAISKPVVLISESIDDIPFDLRAIRIILYDKNNPDWGAALRKSMVLALKEVLANPIESIPGTFKTPVHAKIPEESEVLIRLARLERQTQTLQELLPDPFSESPDAQRPDSHARKFNAGDAITHAKFGRGNVLQVEGNGPYERVQANFESAGVKWIMANYLSRT